MYDSIRSCMEVLKGYVGIWRSMNVCEGMLVYMKGMKVNKIYEGVSRIMKEYKGVWRCMKVC